MVDKWTQTTPRAKKEQPSSDKTAAELPKTSDFVMDGGNQKSSLIKLMTLDKVSNS